MGGYHLKIPGSHPAVTVKVVNPIVVYHVVCPNNAVTSFTLALPTPYIAAMPASPTDWFPASSQSDPLVCQSGLVPAPDVCSGGVMDVSTGATFSATFYSTDHVHSIQVQFHYGTACNGGWSSTPTVQPLCDPPP